MGVAIVVITTWAAINTTCIGIVLKVEETKAIWRGVNDTGNGNGDEGNNCAQNDPHSVNVVLVVREGGGFVILFVG